MLGFSIVVPCKNAERYLGPCLESIWNQRDVDPEVIAVDGGSSDDTTQILRHHRENLQLLTEADEGPADALGKGLRKTTGDIIGWLNADDCYASDALREVRTFLTQNPEVDVVYGAIQHIDVHGEELRTVDAAPWSPEALRFDCFLQTPAVFFRRRIFERCFAPDPQLRYWADYDFWLRLADAGVRFAPLPILLGSRRYHPQGQRWGVQRHDHRVGALKELNDLMAARNGRVASRRVLQYAHAKAASESVLREFSTSFDRTVLRHAMWGLERWNPPRSRWSPVRDQAAVFGRYAAKELEFLARHPNSAVRFLPRPMAEFIQSHFRRKLFKLKVHEPRPVQLPTRYHHTPTPMNAPTISIVTPSLNQAEYLEQTICSVTDQQYSALEYVVQDGGSTDSSLEIIRRHAPRLAHWESAPDRGQAHAINLGMGHTRGEIMAFLNSDDLLLPGSLAYVGRYFQQHPEADVVYGHRLLVDEQGHEIGRWILPPHDDHVLPWADYIPQETMFWRRSAWDRVGGGLDESFHFALDWDLILRFRAAGLQFVRLPRFLGAFRVTEQQKTSQLVETVGIREMARLRRRVLGREPTAREIRRVVRPYLRRHMMCETLYQLGLARY